MSFSLPPLLPFPTPGTTLTSSRGDYLVGARIGDGQYGSVYECLGPFDQGYALKMFRPANRPYEDVKREWSGEMLALERLRHPNIVYIHDAFEHGYLFYLALERCETSLRALLGRPLDDALTIELARQILLALQYLHDNGVVHADLHAGNVLLAQLERPVVKIADLGVSHQLAGAHWFRPQVANPKVWTPELVAAGYTTRQSDLFQLGLLLYQMHAGAAALDVDVPREEVVRQLHAGEPRRRAEALGTPLGAVIARLLRRRDTYRYPSAREVWDDLRTLRPR